MTTGNQPNLVERLRSSIGMNGSFIPFLRVNEQPIKDILSDDLNYCEDNGLKSVLQRLHGTESTPVNSSDKPEADDAKIDAGAVQIP